MSVWWPSDQPGQRNSEYPFLTIGCENSLSIQNHSHEYNDCDDDEAAVMPPLPRKRGSRNPSGDWRGQNSKTRIDKVDAWSAKRVGLELDMDDKNCRIATSDRAERTYNEQFPTLTTTTPQRTRPQTMDSTLNLNTLATSLPNSNLANAEKDLLNNFKGACRSCSDEPALDPEAYKQRFFSSLRSLVAAALSITTLYRSSRQTSKRAYNAGYAAACLDILSMIQQGVSAGGDHAGENPMSVGRIMDWVEARCDAIKAREEEEEEEEQKEKEKDPQPPQSGPKPPPPRTRRQVSTPFEILSSIY